MNRGYPVRKEEVSPSRSTKRADTRRGGYASRRPAGRFPAAAFRLPVTSPNANTGNFGQGTFGQRVPASAVKFMDKAIGLGLAAHPGTRVALKVLEAYQTAEMLQNYLRPLPRTTAEGTLSSWYTAAGTRAGDEQNQYWRLGLQHVQYTPLSIQKPYGFTLGFDWGNTQPAPQTSGIVGSYETAVATWPDANAMAYGGTWATNGLYSLHVVWWIRTALGNANPAAARANVPKVWTYANGRPAIAAGYGLLPEPAMMPVPYRLIPAARSLPNRQSGYGTIELPRTTGQPRSSSMRLGRPKDGVAERKRMGKLVPFLKGIKMTWHAATEAQDFTEAFLGAIPGGDKVKGGLIAQWQFIVANQHLINHYTLAVNLIYNEAEDRAVGKILKKMDKMGLAPGLNGYGQMKKDFWDKMEARRPLSANEKAAQRRARLEAAGKKHLKAYSGGKKRTEKK